MSSVVQVSLNARYYDSGRGQFVSQDPVFWEIAQSPDGKSALSNPQALNSYAYANDNPITSKDPNGRQGVQVGVIIMIGSFLLSLDSAAPYFKNALELKAAQIRGDPTATPAKIEAQLRKGAFNLFEFPFSFVAPEPISTALDIKDEFSVINQTYQAVTGVSQQKLKAPSRDVGHSSQPSEKKSIDWAAIRVRPQPASVPSGGNTSNQMLWTTPSGAVVTSGGTLIKPPSENK